MTVGRTDELKARIAELEEALREAIGPLEKAGSNTALRIRKVLEED